MYFVFNLVLDSEHGEECIGLTTMSLCVLFLFLYLNILFIKKKNLWSSIFKVVSSSELCLACTFGVKFHILS